MDQLENALFENSSIDINALPDIEEVSFSKLSPNYLWIMIIRSNLIYLAFTIGGGIIVLVKNDFNVEIWAYILMGWLFIWMLINVFLPYSFKKKGYAVREKDVSYKSGLWWQKKIVIPFNRIQHCEVEQGPISKIFKLKSLTVFTAGGGSSDLKVSGMPAEEADKLREFVVSKITAEDDTSE